MKDFRRSVLNRISKMSKAWFKESAMGFPFGMIVLLIWLFGIMVVNTILLFLGYNDSLILTIGNAIVISVFALITALLSLVNRDVQEE